MELDEMPEYQKLSRLEKRKITERLIKVWVNVRHPAKAAAIRKEFRDIEKELRAGQRIH